MRAAEQTFPLAELAPADMGAADPFRYVLEKDSPLLANLAALWTVDPGLTERIEALHPRPSYPVQRSKTGAPTVFVPTPDGRTVCLHSRYQPIDEAKRLIDSIDVAERTTFYIFGFGLGYHVELLFDRAGDEAIFCIFEPDLMVLRTAFEQRDFSRMIESRRAMFFTRLDKGDLLTRLTPQSAIISLGATSVVHPLLEMGVEPHYVTSLDYHDICTRGSSRADHREARWDRHDLCKGCHEWHRP